MAIIFIDTCILLQDRVIRGAHLAKVLIGSKSCGIPVFIPAPVLDELFGSFAKDLRQVATESEKVDKKFAALGVELEMPSVDRDALQEKYEAEINGLLAKYRVVTSPYPALSLQQIIRASYVGRKPFKSDGDGYKDYVIFSSLLEELRRQPRHACFLTNNTKDFCNEKGELHEDLQKLLPRGSSIRIFTSADKLYQQLIEPIISDRRAVHSPEDIEEEIKKGTFPGFDLEDELESVLVDELIDSRPDLDDLDTPLNDLSVVTLEEFSVRDCTVSGLEENLITIDIEGNVTMEVQGFMDKSEYFSREFERKLHIHDADWNDYVVSAYDTVDASFKLSLLFDRDQHIVVSSDISIGKRG